MSARDTILTGVLILSIGLVVATGFLINASWKDKFLAIGEVNESAATVDVVNDMSDHTARFDYLVLALFIGLILGIIVTAWFIAAQPIFMFFYFLMIIVGIIVSAVLNNAWVAFASTSAFTNVNMVASLPITDFLMSNLPFYVGIIGFIGLVITFAKPAIVGDGNR